ncbi:MAG: CAP domain-containing protein [Candidatus Electrothrix sp. AUS4]|nr:CAP domain-containing protein [Candidatus Electrothrix sp. AUS4]
MFSKSWMKRRLLEVTVMLMLLILAADSFAVVPARGKNAANTACLLLLLKAKSTPPPMDFEEQVVALTNQQRQAYGCAPLTMDTRLRAAAAGHSKDMAVNDFFSHTGTGNTSPFDRIYAQGYSFSRAGENIAAGYTSPESVVNAWMNSEGHRANILNCGFIHIGVGHYYLQNDTGNVNYGHYWTQVFGSP